MKRISMLVLLAVMVMAGSVWADPPIRISSPWMPGQTWDAGGSGCYYDGTGVCATHSGDAEWCIDFNKIGGDDAGQPILAVADGTVHYVGYSVDGSGNGYGHYIWIQHENNTRSLYAHLQSAPSVTSGAVHRGQKIGNCGSSGTSSPHLHFGLYQWNGTKYVSIEPSPMDGQAITEGLDMESYNFSCEHKAQFPSGTIELTPGESKQVWVEYYNRTPSGSPAWQNGGGVTNAVDVELRSCDASGNAVNSWLYDASWVNALRVGSADQSSVAPGSAAKFSFTIKVPSSAAVGLDTTIHFRPWHSNPKHESVGWMSNWGGMYFHIQVVTSYTFSDLTKVWPVPGDYDGDGTDDIAFLDKTGTGVFCIDYASDGFGSIQDTFPWYGTGPGIWACPANYDGDGKDDYAQLDRDYNNGTLQVNYASNGFSTGFDSTFDWYGTSYNIMPCPADYNGDGKDDYAQLDRLGTGVWRINYAANFGSGFVDTFPWYGTSTTLFPCPADYDGDGAAEIAMLDRSNTGHLLINYPPFVNGFDADYAWYGVGNIIPCPGNYNGDQYDDYAQLNRESGYFGINYGPNMADGFNGSQWSGYGTSDYTNPCPADFDGDGKTDIAIWDQTNGQFKIDYADGGFGSFNLTLTYPGTGLPKLTDLGGDEVLPSTFNLSQNYPNPFNPATTISYSLPEATHVKIEIFNLLGQRVTTLVNGQQEAGQHTITWDGGKHASGVYFYRLNAGEAVETKKMLLLK